MNFSIEPLAPSEIGRFFDWRGGGHNNEALTSNLKLEIGAFQGETAWIFLAKNENQWIGSAQLSLFHPDREMANGETRAILRAVEVLESFRRQGIARLLTQRLIDEAILRGLEEMTLHVEAQNVAACALYREFGFAPFKVAVLRFDERDYPVECWKKRIDSSTKGNSQ